MNAMNSPIDLPNCRKKAMKLEMENVVTKTEKNDSVGLLMKLRGTTDVRL